MVISILLSNSALNKETYVKVNLLSNRKKKYRTKSIHFQKLKLHLILS